MASLADQIRGILEATFDLISGIFVTYVDEHGVEHKNIPAIWYDEPTRFRRDKFNASDMGLLEGNTNRLVLKQSTLRARNIELNIAGYFIINGERWDLAPNEPAFQKHLTPFRGVTDTFVLMYVIRSEVINNIKTKSNSFSVDGMDDV